MSRSGYSDDIEHLDLGRWRGQVASAIRGKRGQAFLRELAAAMDAMPEKRLIANALITPQGDCCTMGVICAARNISVGGIDETEPTEVGALLGIAPQLAAEIAYKNDEGGDTCIENPEQRWRRMRQWVAKKIKPEITEMQA